ncbi:AAA family ATPase [Desulfobacterales bacterium HSG16]|nr:AAA family ATPase [Desulfobacterales bacterium HSG16]
MKIKSLSLRNIGPFIKADMEFLADTDQKPRIVLITGENGSGKSIILDAIRGMFGHQFCELERKIRRSQSNGKSDITLVLEKNGETVPLLFAEFHDKWIELFPTEGHYEQISNIPKQIQEGDHYPNWIADYWASGLASGSYKIDSLNKLQHKNFLINALQGKKKSSDITQIICHFDYLRDSRNQNEQETGERLYEILEKIIEKALSDGGRLSHVSRATYEPVIIQNSQPVLLENLSGGNLYLIQNMVSLLGKMYSVHLLRQAPISELCRTPGLLLIDEAENHLHPKWQKRLFTTILDSFPNLQIIATTHSPFIISSVPNARLFVCKSRNDHCIVVDETSEYTNKPVDEILMSPLFEETLPFNEEISLLIKKREQAILSCNQADREQIETELKAINPEYFSYFDTDRLLEEIVGKESAT